MNSTTNNDLAWLQATATLSVVMLVLYIIGIVWHKKPFDLNMIVPLLLGCAASMAAVKMMTLAFTLLDVANKPEITTTFDSGSIFIGGAIFFLTTFHQALKIVLKAFQSTKT